MIWERLVIFWLCDEISRNFQGKNQFFQMRAFSGHRAAQNSDGRLAHELCSVPPGRAQREAQGYVGFVG